MLSKIVDFYTFLVFNSFSLWYHDRYGNATVVENTERGWKELIFHNIRAVFGYGM
jgi:hypothetical protein